MRINVKKLAERLAALVKDSQDETARDDIRQITRRVYFRISAADHLQSGRVPRRERQRIEQETEEIAGDAICRMVATLDRYDRTEAIRRAVNWACRQWSLARRIEKLTTDAARITLRDQIIEEFADCGDE